MNREYFINKLMNMAKQNGFELDREIIGEVVNNSVFRIISKGSILKMWEKKLTLSLWFLVEFAELII